MSTSTYSLPDPGPDCARYARQVPLMTHEQPDIAQQIQDVADVHAHVAQCAHCQAQLALYRHLDAAVHRALIDRNDVPRFTEAIVDNIQKQQHDGDSIIVHAGITERANSNDHNGTSDRTWKSSSQPGPSLLHRHPGGATRPPLSALVSLAAVLVVALVASVVFLGHGAFFSPGQTDGHGGSRPFFQPAPHSYTWTPSLATSRSTTPQAAFAAGVHLNMCLSEQPRSVTVTWLTSSATFGVAIIHADCGSEGRPTALFTLGVTTAGLADTSASANCRPWAPLGGDYFAHSPTPDEATSSPPPGSTDQIPSWLPLPHHGYLIGGAGESQYPQMHIIHWLYAGQEYVVGRYEGSADQPPTGAVAVVVAHQPGWYVEASGFVSVVVPLADGETFFFAGTAAPDTLVTLATLGLERLDQIVAKPLAVPATSPTPSSSAGC